MLDVSGALAGAVLHQYGSTKGYEDRAAALSGNLQGAGGLKGTFAAVRFSEEDGGLATLLICTDHPSSAAARVSGRLSSAALCSAVLCSAVLCCAVQMPAGARCCSATTAAVVVAAAAAAGAHAPLTGLSRVLPAPLPTHPPLSLLLLLPLLLLPLLLLQSNPGIVPRGQIDAQAALLFLHGCGLPPASCFPAPPPRNYRSGEML